MGEGDAQRIRRAREVWQRLHSRHYRQGRQARRHGFDARRGGNVQIYV